MQQALSATLVPKFDTLRSLASCLGVVAIIVRFATAPIAAGEVVVVVIVVSRAEEFFRPALEGLLKSGFEREGAKGVCVVC
jgi:hypothetical protein